MPNRPSESELPHVRHWIGGTRCDSVRGAFFESYNPENDAAICRVAQATAEDVVRAVESAHQVFASYGALGPSAREQILLRAADLLAERADLFRDLLIREIGSPISKANLEIAIATRVLKANASMARRMTGRTYNSDVPGRWSVGFRKPLGVVAGITPFNVPLIKGIKHSSMPLVTGNTYVWLPSRHTPQVADQIARLYHDAGLPEGAMNVVYGIGSEIGDDLTGAPHVRAVGFTGSYRVGRHVQKRCGELGKRVMLELGGKNPLIVLADADLDAAVTAAIKGGFLYQGQICMASSRVIVEAPVAAEFQKRFVRAAQSVPVGSLKDAATMVGPIIDPTSRERLQGLITAAIDAGAEVLCGNVWTKNCLNPTILSGVRQESGLFFEEAFGPVVTLETARDRDHAILLANAPAGILSAAVFTSNLDAALSVADSLDSAMVHVNDMTIQQEPEVPFGGDAAAGFGREGMETGIDDFTRWKWVTLRH